jgi:hypothetical protein
MEGASSVNQSGNSWQVNQQNNQLGIEEQWEKNLNQPNVDGVSQQQELPRDVKKVIGDMIGNMAIEAIKMHNPAKKISMSGEDE